MSGLVVAYNGSTSGLGNRMRVTLGAANLATHLGYKFAYVWPRGDSFGPKISDLWEYNPGPSIPKWSSRLVGLGTGYVDESLNFGTRKVIQVRTGAELDLPPDVIPWQDTFRTLTPIPAIAHRVNEFWQSHLAGASYVGVQIRTHAVSHEKTKETSSVDWFVRRMTEISEKYPDTRFFVSCDVPEVKEDIVRQFPNAHGILESQPYNTTPAVQLAVADLYLLGSSSHMLGPHHSSFIEMAEFLADGKVSTEKASEDKVMPENWAQLPPAKSPLRPAERAS